MVTSSFSSSASRCAASRVVRNALALSTALVAVVLQLACSNEDPAPPTPAATPETSPVASPDEAPAAGWTFEEVYADDALWPPRLTLVEPVTADDGEVLVKAGRTGVVLFLLEDRQLRMDFGRFGEHTVPASAVDLSEAVDQVRQGIVVKHVPNLLGQIGMWLGNPAADRVMTIVPRFSEIAEKPVLLLFADPFAQEPAELRDLVAPVSSAVGLTALVPITDQGEGEVWKHLHDEGWHHPYVIVNTARNAIDAMLLPGTPKPWLRLSSSQGRILVEGPPNAETVEQIGEYLGTP